MEWLLSTQEAVSTLDQALNWFAHAEGATRLNARVFSLPVAHPESGRPARLSQQPPQEGGLHGGGDAPARGVALGVLPLRYFMKGHVG